MSKTIAFSAHQGTKKANDEWLTPQHVIDQLTHCRKFDLDPCACASHPDRIAKKFFTAADDGLYQPWEGTVFMNPPYGRETHKWMAKLKDHNDGIALVFARTETDWFQKHVFGEAGSILFLADRLTFLDKDLIPAAHNSGAPSVLISYGLNASIMLTLCKLPGYRLYTEITNSTGFHIKAQ